MKTPAHASPRQGSAIVTVMLVVVLTFTAVGSLFAYSASTIHRIRIMTEAIRAKAIAEAGANRAYNALSQNFALRNVDTLYTNEPFADGSYHVTFEALSNGWTRMIAQGTFGRATQSLGLDMDIASDGGAADDPGTPGFFEGLDKAVFANGTLTVNGNAKGIDGWLHTNNSWDYNGTYANVVGSISAQSSKSPIPAEFEAPWSNIPFPLISDLDFQAWLDEQAAAGVSVVRLNGNQTYKKDATFNGITIVNGDVTFLGAGNRTITGMLYVAGNLTANGSTTLDGAILVGGVATINGASAILTGSTDYMAGGEEEEGSEEKFTIASEVWWD
jgi:hypothetical protein